MPRDPKDVPSKFPLPPSALSDFGYGRALSLYAETLHGRPTPRARAARPLDHNLPNEPQLPPAHPSESPCDDVLSFSDLQISTFEATLSSDELSCFRGGTRLPDPNTNPIRGQLLSTLTAAQRNERGLHFPDDPPLANTPPRSSSRVAAEHVADVRSSTFRPPPNVRAILMVLWHVADPLWLDLVVRSMRDGINLGVSHDPTSSSSEEPHLPRNMINPEDPAQLKLLIDSMEKDISRGNSTAFSKVPLFDCYRSIPCGVVPKKDEDIWRFIKNYSYTFGDLPSINDVTPKARPHWCRFLDVVRRFNRARGGLASTWDMSNAYPFFKIRDCDRHLTVSHVKDLGFSHRLRGDMGNAQTGYMWEIIGGRLLSTLYFVLSFSTKVLSDGTVVYAPPSLPPDFMSKAVIVHPEQPPCPQGFGDISKEIMITDAAQQLFASPSYQSLLLKDDSVDLTDTSRWVDDWINFCRDHAQALRNDHALVTWHRLLGAALAKDKFLGAAAPREFYGITFNTDDGTIYFSDTKMDKIFALLQTFCRTNADGKRCKNSLKQWSSLLGYLNFFARVFPHMRAFTVSISRQLYDAAHIERSNKRVSKTTLTLAPHDDTVREIDLWLKFCRSMPRSIVPDLSTDNEAALTATVIAHSDWSGAPLPGRLGFVVLSHGFYAQAEMPAQFYEPVEPDALAVSPAVGEATALLAFLNSCEDIIRDAHVVCFTDNETLYKRFYRGKTKRGSRALDARLQDIALTLSALNARLSLYHIPGTECTADSLTRTPKQDFSRLHARLAVSMPSVAFSEQVLRLSPTPTLQTSQPRS